VIKDEEMNIIIISPSLDTNQNVSGISSVTKFVIENNKEHKYLHFGLGKKDDEKRNLFRVFKIFVSYFHWLWIMISFRRGIIHFNLALSKYSIIRDTPLIMIARIFRKRLLLHIHGGDLLSRIDLPALIKISLMYILNDRNHKIVLSPLERELLIKNFNCSRISILPNCVDLKEAKKFTRNYKSNNILKLLFMSRISSDKGLESIYEALESLQKQGIKFKFIMAGKGPDEKEFVQKFQKLLGPDFEFIGVASGTQKDKLLEQSDVYLLPSLYEGLPMGLLESMAFGLVPITTNVGSIRYVVKDGINGIIIGIKSSEEMAAAIEKLSFDCESRKNLSINAKNFIFSDFDPVSYIVSLNEIYNYA
jgi:glycosyltransferase involved in cell wall biosynthesis